MTPPWRLCSLATAVDALKRFLATAPSTFPPAPVSQLPDFVAAFNQLLLPNNETVSCVLWNKLYHITGTDIVRTLSFRFTAFGRPIRNWKKFEEGVFSDLRNLKTGTDAILEEAKVSSYRSFFLYRWTDLEVFAVSVAGNALSARLHQDAEEAEDLLLVFSPPRSPVRGCS